MSHGLRAYLVVALSQFQSQIQIQIQFQFQGLRAKVCAAAAASTLCILSNRPLELAAKSA